MRLFFFAALFLISSSLYSQDCKLNSFKDKRDAKKIVRLINNKDFSHLIENTVWEEIQRKE